MKKDAGMRAVGAQAVKELLGGKWMLIFVVLTVCQFVLAFAARMTAGISPFSFILYTMMEGFVTAEVLILYQKKESRNMQHLAVYCLVMAVIMLTVFVVLTVIMVTMASSKDALPEDMLEEWTRDIAGNFPIMILSTILTGLTGAYYFFMRLTLKQGVYIMDRKRVDRDWRMPTAILTAAVAALSLAEELMSPFDLMSMGTEIVGFLRSMAMVVLLWPGSEYR